MQVKLACTSLAAPHLCNTVELALMVWTWENWSEGTGRCRKWQALPLPRRGRDGRLESWSAWESWCYLLPAATGRRAGLILCQRAGPGGSGAGERSTQPAQKAKSGALSCPISTSIPTMSCLSSWRDQPCNPSCRISIDTGQQRDTREEAWWSSSVDGMV